MTHPAGTPLYLSPEMCKGCYGSQTDVYSAGVMCFQLLTGMFPYWPNMEFHTPTMKEVRSTALLLVVGLRAFPAEGLRRQHTYRPCRSLSQVCLLSAIESFLCAPQPA